MRIRVAIGAQWPFGTTKTILKRQKPIRLSDQDDAVLCKFIHKKVRDESTRKSYDLFYICTEKDCVLVSEFSTRQYYTSLLNFVSQRAEVRCSWVIRYDSAVITNIYY